MGSIRFRLELSYQTHSRITAAQTGRGDLVKDAATEWALEPIGAQQTRAIYRAFLTQVERLTSAVDGLRVT